MKRKIAIYHFSPLELYPPVMNLLNDLARDLRDDSQILVFTTSLKDRENRFHLPDQRIVIQRLARFTLGLSLPHRLFQYIRYFFLGFLQSIFWRPTGILYFETISSFIPIVLTKWVYRGTPLFIHYYEYMSPAEYRNTYLNERFHEMEKKIYSVAEWISHSNSKRVELFLQDLGNPGLRNLHVLPNYPPESWQVAPVARDREFPLRLVHVGSLGALDKLYLPEVMRWISGFKGKITLDLYSFGLPKEITELIKGAGDAWITWKGAARYQDLPRILSQYHVGLILYKGGSENTIYSAPNKLFEYLVCGLDVWYPEELTGAHAFDSAEWPKTLRLDFSRLESYDPLELAERKKGQERKIQFTSRQAASELMARLAV